MLTIVPSLKHKNTQPVYIFNRENPQNSEPQNGPRRGLGFIALQTGKLRVRCHRCQEGSILIHRDPCGWSDVLDQPGRIMGHCLSGKCSSDGNEDSQAEFSKNLFKIRNQNKNIMHTQEQVFMSTF